MIIAGLDVAFSNDYMAIVIVKKNRDKKIRLEHLATWRKMDWRLWKQDMKAKKSKFKIDYLYVDQTNNQSVVMELKEIGIRVNGVSFSNSSKHDMIRNVSKQIDNGDLVLPVIQKLESPRQKQLVEELWEQLNEQEYHHNSVHPRLSHPQGRHDDLLWALCLALYGCSLHHPSRLLGVGSEKNYYGIDNYGLQANGAVSREDAAMEFARAFLAKKGTDYDRIDIQFP